MKTLFFASIASLSFAQNAADTTTIEGYMAANNIKANRLKEGVFVATTQQGTGDPLRNGSYLKVQYSGKLLNGKEFDRSEATEPFIFQLGYRQVIQAWDMALVGQKKGAKITLLTPPTLGYGNTEVGAIPANSPLVFDINILDILNQADYDNYMKEQEKREKQRFEALKQQQFVADKKSIADYTTANKMDWKTTPSGLQYAITKKGKGDNAKLGNKVQVYYEGKLLSEKVFDSNFGKIPFAFEVGKNRVIEGWEEAIKNFNKGSEGIVVIPSKLGYGATPLDDGVTVIPANSVLIFKIQVLEIQK